jgi:hypothetical protein
MKRAFLIFILACSCRLYAQQPEPIFGKNKMLHSNEYYLEQKALWKKETEKDPKNANAWYYYYRADRNAYIVGEETDSLNTKGINRFERLKKTVSEMEKQVPESYQYNFVKWLNGNNDLSLLPYLEKAHMLAPSWTEPLMSLAYCYELKNNRSLRDQYAKAYYDSGEFSQGLLIYGSNLLVGLEKNAIILTEGDKDTDAILLLQGGKNLRKDIRLVNLNLLMGKEYREAIFRELKIPAWDIDPYGGNEDYELYRKNIILKIAQNKDKRPVYAAVSVSAPYTEHLLLAGNLYNTGLASLYSTRKIESVPLIEKNYTKLYSLDYLRNYPPGDATEEMVHRFNMNYLPALDLLIAHEQASGNNAKVQQYQALADKIRADSPDKDQH